MKTSKALLILFAVMVCLTLSYGEAQAQVTSFTFHINWIATGNMNDEAVDITINFYNELLELVDEVDLIHSAHYQGSQSAVSTWSIDYQPDPNSVSWEVDIDIAIPFETNTIMDGDDVVLWIPNDLDDVFVYDD